MPSSSSCQSSDVLDFWRHAGPQRWFARDVAFDREFRERFLEAHFAAARGELFDWEGSADGVLALLVLLDQFRAMPFVARAICLPPTVWRWLWRDALSRMDWIGKSTRNCARSFICLMSTQRILTPSKKALN